MARKQQLDNFGRPMWRITTNYGRKYFASGDRKGVWADWTDPETRMTPKGEPDDAPAEVAIRIAPIFVKKGKRDRRGKQ